MGDLCLYHTLHKQQCSTDCMLWCLALPCLAQPFLSLPLHLSLFYSCSPSPALVAENYNCQAGKLVFFHWLKFVLLFLWERHLLLAPLMIKWPQPPYPWKAEQAIHPFSLPCSAVPWSLYPALFLFGGVLFCLLSFSAILSILTFPPLSSAALQISLKIFNDLCL